MRDTTLRRTTAGAPLLLRALLTLLCVALLADGAAAQQELVIRGRVLGPAGEGVGEQRVVLHRVDAGGGATIAETLSGADGTYELRAPTSPADTAAVLFVAARYEDELYIGPPFRVGEPAAEQQDIQVGLPELSASALLEQDGGLPMPVQRRTQQSRTWLLILIPLLGVAGVIVYALLPKSRIPHDRTLLIRVAELDERMDDAPVAQRESMRDERARLIAELRQG
jgi:hypothetical protein